MKRFQALTAIVVFVAAIGLSIEAHAVTVTDGTLSGGARTTDWGATYNMAGDNFTMTCPTPGFTGRCGFFQSTGPLFVGGQQSVQMDTRVDILPGGVVTWEGNLYRPQGTLSFDGPEITPPSNAVLTAPFAMSGTLDLLHPVTLADVGDITLTGLGTASALFGSLGQLDSIVYTFAGVNGGPVIPEPSTVLLVASGLAGLGLWRRVKQLQA